MHGCGTGFGLHCRQTNSNHCGPHGAKHSGRVTGSADQAHIGTIIAVVQTSVLQLDVVARAPSYSAKRTYGPYRTKHSGKVPGRADHRSRRSSANSGDNCSYSNERPPAQRRDRVALARVQFLVKRQSLRPAWSNTFWGIRGMAD
jgi:hypothetical protein